MKTLIRLSREEDGQDLIEYALLAAFIALFVVGAVQLVGTGIDTLFKDVDQKLKDAAAGP